MKYQANKTLSVLMLTLTSLVSPPTAEAFSSISRPNGNYLPTPASTPPSTSAQEQPKVVTDVPTTAPWRVTLDLGREPLSNMPFDWARSGCRMPLTIKSEFSDDGLITPLTETIFFTGPDGAVVRPVQGGGWSMSPKRQGVGRTVNFSFTFPESMARRDVSIDAGMTLELTGTAYSRDELDQLNQAFYDAREATWQVGQELNQMSDRQSSAKKWNEETQQWEKRYANENPFAAASKRIGYWISKTEQSRKNAQRPDPNQLSEQGNFPGLASKFYFDNAGGIVRNGKNGPVMGTWSAQPITDQPVSYRG